MELFFISFNKGGGTVINWEDMPIATAFNWYKATNGYAVSHIPSTRGRKISLHRLLMDIPKDKIVDHINHNILDNRKENLRIVNQRGNLQNLKDHGLFPLGVTYDKCSGWFKSQIKINGKSKHLGIFKDPISGSILYNFVNDKIKEVV